MCQDTPTILLANDPRSYREALAAAVAMLRPGLNVCLGDPAALAADVARLAPALVVCSRIDDTMRAVGTAWVLLYPDGARYAATNHGGREEVRGDFSLPDLVALVDRVAPPPAA